MPRYVAFLRGVNVGGARTVKMDSLRSAFESLGFSRVATFIASGNVVFETTATDGRALEKAIEGRLREAMGYDVAAFVRTDAELAQIASHDPFGPEIDAVADLNVVFLADTVDENLAQEVLALRTEANEYRVLGREIYWLRRRREGAPFSTVPLDRTLRRPFTIRGARTVKKIAEKSSPTGPAGDSSVDSH